jgi:hypothetical protein
MPRRAGPLPRRPASGQAAQTSAVVTGPQNEGPKPYSHGAGQAIRIGTDLQHEEAAAQAAQMGADDGGI